MDKPFAITLDVGSSLANKTGSWRTERPVYVQRAAPCGSHCPAGEDVQAWLYHAEEGDYETAWRQIMQSNPLPAVMGRVCYHPCETACNRGELDEAVGINSVERFLGDEAIRCGWTVGPVAAPSGKRVLVVGAGPSGLSAAYGGGNTAMDAARTAKRLGAEEAIVVYRRTRDRMPAHDFEVEEALEEGVLMKWLSTIKHLDDGRLQLERMELDETGFPQPTGEVEELDADSLVLALGQDTDLSLLDRVDGIRIDDGVVEVGPDLMTGHPGIFAGGDIVPAERTVTVGIGHGRTAARHIDAWLRGARAAQPEAREPAAFEGLNTWYYADAPKTVRPQLDLVRRQSTFDEVTGGLDARTALFEARRCLSCGNCFACDNCYGVCPDNAVIKLEPGGAYAYAIDLDYCKGCGICAAECPSGAIKMVAEAI